MRVHLNCYSSDPPPWQLDLIVGEFAFDGLRRDYHGLLPLGRQLYQHRSRGLEMNLLLNPADPARVVAQAWDVASECALLGVWPEAVEIGNEWDIGGRVSPARARELWTMAHDAIKEKCPAIITVSGGIASLSPDSLDWLRAVGPIPTDVVGFHPYRTTSRPDDPRFLGLHDAQPGRTFWQTECGWHTAPFDRDFPLCWFKKRWTEEQVADFLVEDMRQHEAAGVEVYTVYQITDGPGEKPFGIFAEDGRNKLAAYVARRFKPLYGTAVSLGLGDEP